jgi:hypothetical protein
LDKSNRRSLYGARFHTLGHRNLECNHEEQAIDTLKKYHWYAIVGMWLSQPLGGRGKYVEKDSKTQNKITLGPVFGEVNF